MFQHSIEPSTKDIKQALKSFTNPNDLERSSARHWPAVLERSNSGVVPAIRDILRLAIGQLEAHVKRTLVRDRYLVNQSIDDLAQRVPYSADPSSLHRWLNDDLKELQVIIGGYNRDAHRRLRRQRFTTHGPVIGIEKITADLAAHIRDRAAAPVVVIEGMGGLGKTTLARQIANQIADDATFTDILWTSAQQVEFDTWAGEQRQRRAAAMRTEDLLRQIATELGLDPTINPADLHTNVVAWCKRQPYLIVFDNLESLDDMSALAPLIDELAGPSRILITTREHTTEALPTRIQRRYHAIEELGPEQSIHLLRVAATHVGASSMRHADEADLLRIYDVTGGNPLALWLVAGQSDSQPWQLFLQEFVEHSPGRTTVHDMYRYLYERAWELLSDDARQVLLAMLRFERGTDYDALRTLSFMEQPPFRRAVAELRHRMLLLFDGSASVYIHRLTYSFLRRGIMEWA